MTAETAYIVISALSESEKERLMGMLHSQVNQSKKNTKSELQVTTVEQFYEMAVILDARNREQRARQAKA